MEFLLLLLVVPAVWLFLLPRRVLRRARQLAMVKPAILGAIVLVGWAMVSGFGGGAAADADYTRSDAQLRALLD